MSAYEPATNRMRRMRARDGRRWVNAYREKAWEAAVEESRSRWFLGSLYYACVATLRMFNTRSTP